MNTQQLLDTCRQVLSQNDREHYTVPANDVYPHQWLWDSCFTAIGLRHLDITRAKQEILSLLEGQWHNGMIPGMIFNQDDSVNTRFWRSDLNPNSPDRVSTSGLTQPPMLAEAVTKIGELLPLPEKRSWYKQVFNQIVKYHEWLYRERDPHNDGLVILVHPWESGLDNAPYWLTAARMNQAPTWVNLIEGLHLTPLVRAMRNDTRFLPRSQRMHTIDSLIYFSVFRRLRRKHYDSELILRRSHFAVEDVAFNSILVRANKLLKKMAETIDKDLPDDLLAHMNRAHKALEQLWNEGNENYLSRDYTSHKLIHAPSVASLLPIYAGVVDEDKATLLLKKLHSHKQYLTEFPIPSVAANEPEFEPERYWDGPTWVNINWLLIDGLKRLAGGTEIAHGLASKTLTMIDQMGIHEYYNPMTGVGLGARDFSWTAALTIDLLFS